jgi:tRNA(Ile)-lysidine synthetase-like protein
VIERIAPRGLKALARAAESAAADEAYLQAAAIKAARSLVLFSTDGVQLNVEAVTGWPGALALRVVRHVLELAAPGHAFSTSHLSAVRALASRPGATGHLDLPGVTVERLGPHMRIRAAGGDGTGARREGFTALLPVPGAVSVPEPPVSFSADVVAEAGSADLMASRLPGADVAVLQACALTLPLTVRNRWPGDRFRPLGAPGRRKIQDLMVDRKIPRRERGRVPIVVDAAGRIVWVVGVAIAEECRVTAPSGGVVVLKAYR